MPLQQFHFIFEILLCDSNSYFFDLNLVASECQKREGADRSHEPPGPGMFSQSLEISLVTLSQHYCAISSHILDLSIYSSRCFLLQACLSNHSMTLFDAHYLDSNLPCSKQLTRNKEIMEIHPRVSPVQQLGYFCVHLSSVSLSICLELSSCCRPGIFFINNIFRSTFANFTNLFCR